MKKEWGKKGTNRKDTLVHTDVMRPQLSEDSAGPWGKMGHRGTGSIMTALSSLQLSPFPSPRTLFGQCASLAQNRAGDLSLWPNWPRNLWSEVNSLRRVFSSLLAFPPEVVKASLTTRAPFRKTQAWILTSMRGCPQRARPTQTQRLRRDWVESHAYQRPPLVEKRP